LAKPPSTSPRRRAIAIVVKRVIAVEAVDEATEEEVSLPHTHMSRVRNLPLLKPKMKRMKLPPLLHNLPSKVMHPRRSAHTVEDAIVGEAHKGKARVETMLPPPLLPRKINKGISPI
jgi:hypothetical protein